MKRFNPLLPAISLLFVFLGCAGFPKKFSNIQPLVSEKLTAINGQYSIKPLKGSIEDTSYLNSNNAFAKFYRGKGSRSRDTFLIENINRYSFEINVADEDRIEVIYFKDSIPFRTIYMRYRFKKDGYIYLKNQNVKVRGVPYILGGMDIKKLRLGIIDNMLIIDEVHHSSGALLLIIGDSKTWTYRHQYERVK